MPKAYAATDANQTLSEFEYELGELRADEVELEVLSCGICHSDLSMLDNDWQRTEYPFVPGHEVVGRVVAAGENVLDRKVGDIVGVGWYSRSCLHCPQCLGGDHNLCRGESEEIIVGRHGGFADRVRCHWLWATPIPDSLDLAKAGPLFCGGITVFNPIVQNNIKPTDRVGVIGIGGLGHLALQFLNKWGCEVTAFSSNDAKSEEARQMGAHNVVNSRDSSALAACEGSLDFILSTVNVTLDWDSYLNALSPRGVLHVVGATLEPIPVPAFSLIGAQKSVSGTPLGSPQTTAEMINFCARHEIAPVTEHFPMSKVNDAIEHLRSGNARYRVVLDADWG